MAIIHSDRFTEASTTALESHAPNIGSGYTKTFGPTQNVGAGTGEVAFVTSESVYQTNTTSTSADGYVEAVMAGTSFAVIYFREQGSGAIGEGYQWQIFPSYSKLVHRSAGGTLTDIGATDSTPLINMSVSSQTFKVVYTGSTFDFYLDGVLKYSRTDSTLNAAGRVSIDANAGVSLLDLIVDGGAPAGPVITGPLANGGLTYSTLTQGRRAS